MEKQVRDLQLVIVKLRGNRATTPNIVGLAMLGVVATVLAVFASRYNNSQQCWDLQYIVRRIQPIRLRRPCVMRVRGPNNVGRAAKTDPKLLRFASATTEQKKCWELLPQKFDRFQTFFNNSQQHAAGCANRRDM